MTAEEEAYERFDQMGEAQVLKQVLMWDAAEQRYAFGWLKLRSERSLARNEASQAEQAAIARFEFTQERAAARIDRRLVVIAIIGSAVSIVIAILSWLEPRH